MVSRRGANDPTRRDRIVAAALEVVIDVGVHGTTHRKIADQAGVPLGSVTYYFDSLHALIRSAFGLLVETMSVRYAEALRAAPDLDAACDAVTDLICGEDYASQRELVAIYEMYAFANHDAEVTTMMRDWVTRSHESLSLHFSPEARSAIDALVEGWPIHRSLAAGTVDRAVVRKTIAAITVAWPPD